MSFMSPRSSVPAAQSTHRWKYLVASDGCDWHIYFRGRKAGDFRSKTDAVDRATRLAKECAGLGLTGCVVVLDGDQVERRVYARNPPVGDQGS
jgi:hypothetical protein